MASSKFLTIKNMGNAFIGCLIILGLLIVSAAYFNNLNINKAEGLWDRVKGEKTEKAYILNSIYSGIGYGGMIHSFKNYIIRKEASQWNKTYISFGKARSLIANYQSLTLSKQDRELLKPIIIMIDEYEVAMSKAAMLVMVKYFCSVSKPH